MHALGRDALGAIPLALAVKAAEQALLRQARGVASAAVPAFDDPAVADALAALAAGAAAAVASKHLAVAAPRSLGLVGCNDTGRQLARAHQAVFGALELHLADADPAAAARLAAELGGREASAEDAAACDIVCLAAANPAVQAAWIADGAHVNAAAEPDAALLARAVVVADRPSTGRPSLAQVVAGESAGRVGAEITLFQWSGAPAVAAALSSIAAGTGS